MKFKKVHPHKKDMKEIETAIQWLIAKNKATINTDQKFVINEDVCKKMLRHIEAIGHKNQKWPTNRQISKAAYLTVLDISDNPVCISPKIVKCVTVLLALEMMKVINEIKDKNKNATFYE